MILFVQLYKIFNNFLPYTLYLEIYQSPEVLTYQLAIYVSITGTGFTLVFSPYSEERVGEWVRTTQAFSASTISSLMEARVFSSSSHLPVQSASLPEKYELLLLSLLLF